MTTRTDVRGGIESKLAVLGERERIISSNRRALHKRIDGLYLSAPRANRQTTLIDVLEDDERDISANRKKLHIQIDGLRTQIGLPPTRYAWS